MKRTVLLSIAYDGAPFSGVAVQDNARTVGGVLLGALQRLDPSVLKLRVASRTDAGVHARDQRVAFDTAITVPNRAWVRGLLPYLPPTIVVTRAASVAVGFNPRFETVEKRYRYLLLCQFRSDPFWFRRAWRVGPIERPHGLEAMRSELLPMLGTHDFAGFASARDQRENTVRTMNAIDVVPISDSPSVVAVDVTGNGFLHNMVRIIVGTAVDVARGRLAPGAIASALSSRDRRELGMTAPPDGLYLERLTLNDEGTDPWPPPDAPDPG